MIGILGPLISLDDFVLVALGLKSLRLVRDIQKLINPLDHVIGISFECGRLAVNGKIDWAGVSLPEVSFGRFIDGSAGVPATSTWEMFEVVFEV